MLLDSFAKHPSRLRIKFPSPQNVWQLWDGPLSPAFKCDLATTKERKLNRRNFCPNSVCMERNGMEWILMYVVIHVWYGMGWYGTVCMLLHVMHVVHGLYHMHSLHVMHVMHIMYVMHAMYVMYVLCVVCVTYVVDVTHGRMLRT